MPDNLIKPMLANAIDIAEIGKRCSGYVMEPKLDGVRCLISANDIWTRTGQSLKAKLPELHERVKFILHSDFVIDCEIGYWKVPGTVMDFNKTMRVIGSGPAEAIRKQEENEGKIEFCAFDILCSGGFMDFQPDKVRRRLLLNRVLGTEGSNPSNVVARYQSFDSEYLHHIFSLGGEGVMLKNPDASYQQGKRPARHWYKIKAFKTADVFITGFDPGQGKYEGQVGALILSVYDVSTQQDVVVGRCSGFTDAMRLDMTKNWDNYYRQAIEVKYFGRVGLTEGGLRHPQFVRMRPDKNAIECTLSGL